MSESRKSRWRFWTALVVVLAFLLYPLSFGPYFVLYDTAVSRNWWIANYLPRVSAIYGPIWRQLALGRPGPIQYAIAWYIDFWIGLSRLAGTGPDYSALE
jgi:hypothetical protein